MHSYFNLVHVHQLKQMQQLKRMQSGSHSISGHNRGAVAETDAIRECAVVELSREQAAKVSGAPNLL